MKSEWKTIRADEFCSLVTDGTHDSPKPQAAGRKLITSKHLKGYYLDFESANWISSEDYEKVIARSSVEQWDILYSMIGTIGNVYLEKNPVVDYACKNVGIFKFGGNCNKAYWMYYYLKSPQAMEFIKAHLRGTTQLYVPLATLREMPVPVPDEEEMNKIVASLRTLDDKIQCSIKINDNLLEQMQALYKSWFVDYRPFGGVMPTSWTQTGIYSLANIIYGAPFASKQFNTEGNGKPIIRIRDLKDQQFATYTTEVHPKGYLLHPGDIVVGMDGEFRPYIWGNDEAWLNQRVCVFENKRPNGKAFLYFTIKPLLFAIEQTQVATTVIHIGKKDFDAFEIMLPDTELLDAFDVITTPMVEQIVSNSIENKRLAIMRDVLLPKLMSGEIDVSAVHL